VNHDTCNDYCLNYGCQRMPDCPARDDRIERVAKVAKRKTMRQRAGWVVKTILKRVAFGLLSLVAVLGMCAAVVMIFNGVK
jgi:hypothetical protein